MTFQELGEHIKRRREGMGLSLDELATRTKVSSRVLMAIESGNSSVLPHAVYAKSFVRACGKEVGIPPGELDPILDRLFPVQTPSAGRSEGFLPPVAAPAGSSDTPRRVAFLLIFFILLGGVAWGGWYVATNYGNALVALVSDTLGLQSAPATPADGSSARDATQQAAGPSEAVAPAGNAAEEAAAPQPAAASAEAAQAEQGASAEVAFTSRPIKVGTGMNTVELKVYSSCWVRPQIDGARGRDYTLNTGDTLIVSYKGKAELTLSNAGGVVMTHNGKAMDSPGGEGEQVTIQFSGK